MTPAREASGLRHASHTAYDRAQRVASGRVGLVIGFVWAVAEATVWPIIPDFAVVPMAAVARLRGYVPLAGCVLGMAVGGCLNLLFSYTHPTQAHTLLAALPLARADQLGYVSRVLTVVGPHAFLFQPWSGVPFKTWAVAAGGLRLNLLVVIPAFIVGRGFRVGFFSVIAGGLGLALGRFVRDHFLVLLALYVALFAVGFWLVIVRG